ncbi:MAG TPA: sigma-70 family RNA polymerase sigma factor, partial [Terriglobales bacterium]
MPRRLPDKTIKINLGPQGFPRGLDYLLGHEKIMANAAATDVGGEVQAPKLDFGELLEQYEGALWRLAAGYVDQSADREDLFQEIAVALWQALPRYRGEASLRTFLYRIAHNTAITHATRVRKRSRSEEPLQDVVPAGQPNPEQAVLQSERARRLSAGIRELPLLDRQLTLLHLEGLSYAEIEEVTGRSEAMIGSRLTRVREKLKR